MAPEAPETAPPAAAFERTEATGDIGYGTAEFGGRASLPQLARGPKPYQKAQQPAAATLQAESSSESDEAPDSETLHRDNGREHGATVDSDSGESLRESSAAVLDGNHAEHEEVSATADVTVTSKAIAERASIMYVAGAVEPVASGLLPLASGTTKALVKLGAEWKEGLKDDYVKALSQSFGNWDRVVGLGWLLADAVHPVGTPLLSRKDAHAVGLKAGRGASQIKAEVRAAKLVIQRAACKPGADREGLEERLAEAERKVLHAAIDVGVLPQAPAAVAVSHATGSRKRACEEEAELSHEAAIESLNDGLLQCQKWVKQAEAELAQVSRVGESKRKVLARMGRKLQDAVDAKKNAGKFLDLYQDAKEARLLSVIDELSAENYVLTARLAVSDAQRDIYQAQWEHTSALEGSE